VCALSPGAKSDPIGALIALSLHGRYLLYDPTSLKELDDQYNERDNQEHMNQIADDSKSEAERPKNQEY
jgi:hypothetical protein